MFGPILHTMEKGLDSDCRRIGWVFGLKEDEVKEWIDSEEIKVTAITVNKEIWCQGCKK